MKKGEIRDKITDAVDKIESEADYILEGLKEVEEIAGRDAEAVSKEDIEAMQAMIIETIKSLTDLMTGLY